MLHDLQRASMCSRVLPRRELECYSSDVSRSTCSQSTAVAVVQSRFAARHVGCKAGRLGAMLLETPRTPVSTRPSPLRHSALAQHETSTPQVRMTGLRMVSSALHYFDNWATLIPCKGISSFAISARYLYLTVHQREQTRTDASATLGREASWAYIHARP